MSKKYEIEKRTRWKCPDEIDARILGSPNIVKPLHGCPPRTFMGQTAWDKLRKRIYYLADYKCQICGVDCSAPGQIAAHELYTVNYIDGTSVYEKAICICPSCHNMIHSGRLLTLFKQGNFLYPKKKVLSVIEHGFKLIHEWNEAHPDSTKLKAYETITEYIRCENIKKEVEELIEKYNIEFWGEDKKSMAKWGDWKLIYGNKEYPTPYKDYAAWEKAMGEKTKEDVVRQMNNPFSGGAFDEIEKLLASS